MTRRGIVQGVVLAAMLVVAALIAVPQPTDESGPGGTLALERFLQRMGLEVRSEQEPPDRGTYVLLRDLRTEEQAERLLSWVVEGGRLVVAEPGSSLLAEAGLQPRQSIGSSRPEVLHPACVAPEIAGVEALAVAPDDAGFSGLPTRAIGCFPGDDHDPFLVVVPRGSGTIIGLGGVSPLTNEFLRTEGNAALALRLVGSGGPVVFGPPVPSGFGAGKGLWASLPSRAKGAAVVLVLAAGLFAVSRGRRLGRPVQEEPLVVVPASQLAQAAANLYRNAGAAGHAGALLRRAAAWRLAGRFGLRGADPEAVGRVLVADGMRDALDVLDRPDPRDDDELVALGRDVARVEAAAGRDLR
jgi:hypothetical protein